MTVVFDGYMSSPKDHDHKRRAKYHSSNISLNQQTPCTISRARFLANGHNKTQMIQLLSHFFQTSGIEVLLANDDADTLIVATALRYGLTRNVEVRAEDTDVICLLIHHCTRASYNLYVSIKFETYDIKRIRENLPQNSVSIFCSATASWVVILSAV